MATRSETGPAEADPGYAAMLDLKLSLAPQVYRALRQLIIRCELAPGTALSEVELARSFATSRQPVREALIKLAEEGLLEVRPQRGTFIRGISKADVAGARFVREAIETRIVRELAARPDPRLIETLTTLLDEQAELAPKRLHDFMRLDEQFHRTLAEAAGRLYGWKVVEGAKVQMDRVRHLAIKHFPQQQLVAQHRQIVDSIAQGSPDRAEQAMHDHLQLILHDLALIEAQHPEFFV